MSFGNPWALLAMLALPSLWLLARHSRSGLEWGRTLVSTTLRTLLFAMIVLAIADARWESVSRRGATVFLLDYSQSIPPEEHENILERVQKHLAKLPDGDRAGVVVFGKEAMVETSLDVKPVFSHVQSVVQRGATDIAAGLRLALALFPEGYQKRIVLISDGNENRGVARAEVERARSQGVTIDIWPVRYSYPGEVRVEALYVPGEVLEKETYPVTAVVEAEHDGPATVRLLRNGSIILSEKVELKRGKNVFTVKEKIPSPGAYRYEAWVEAPGDSLPQNNRIYAYAHCPGGARLLVVGGRGGEENGADDLDPLLRELGAEGIQPDVVDPENLGGMVSTLNQYDAIAFVNVAASRVPPGVLEAIEAAVHNAGVGFLMVGGPDSFGPGGYRGGPIEELLPVSMDQPQHRVIPNGALVVILHTCEFADGNYWAKEIATASMQALGSRDYFGAIEYGWQGGYHWVPELTRVEDPEKIRKAIQNSSPGDMPDFDTSLSLAHRALKPIVANRKHVVVISDGDPNGPLKATIDAMVADGISVSMVAIFPHGNVDVDKMKVASEVWGKGRFYHPQDPRKLPQIFLKEATTITRSMIIEGVFQPVMQSFGEPLKGITELPPLHGYVLTRPKPGAEVMLTIGQENDVLLAQWYHGVGRTMAFTSDATRRWGKDWVAWPQYRKFWAQAVRSTLRTVQRGPYRVEAEVARGKGVVTIEAIREDGRPDVGLQFLGASVTGPEGRRIPLPQFRQVQAGRYEAEFEPGGEGIYSINLATRGAGGKMAVLTGTCALPYPEEFRDLRTNMALLTEIREATGGRDVGDPKKFPEGSVFVRTAQGAIVSQPIWPLLLTLAVLFFPLDVFIRKVALEREHVKMAWNWVKGRFRRERAPAAVSPTLKALAQRKAEVRIEVLAAKGEAESFDLGASTKARKGRVAEPGPQPADRPGTAAPPPSGGGALDRLLEVKKKAREELKGGE